MDPSVGELCEIFGKLFEQQLKVPSSELNSQLNLIL